MKRWVVACAVLGLLGPAAWAGVVVETEVKSADAPERTGSEVFYAQGEMTRTDVNTADGGKDSIIFRDEAMFFVDHGKKVCQKIDKKAIDSLSEQLGAVMKQMESLPPEQRAMMEKMMKGKMPGMKKPPVRRVEAGATDQVGEYPCTVYTFYKDDEKEQDVCLADKSVGDDIFEAMGAFRALAEFAEGLMKVAENLPFANMIDIPYKEFDELGGFPVRTRAYDDKGKLVWESTLKSVTRRDIEAEAFAIPKGYKIKSLDKEIGKGR